MNIYSSAKDAANRTQAVIEKVCEDVFLLQERETTVSLEVSSGIIQFVSCLYILPVLPGCIEDAGYDTEHIIVVISYLCFGGCILSGFLTNLPFVVAPPAAVSIFLAVTLAEKHISISEGSIGVIISGTLLLLAGIFPPILILLANLIPDSILAATAVGIGLLTALAGAIHISLIVNGGDDALLKMGEITPEVIISVISLCIVAISLHYHIRGAFCLGILFGTIAWWAYADDFPSRIVSVPILQAYMDRPIEPNWSSIILLSIELTFLYVMTLNGLMRSLSDLGNLTKPDGAVPGGRWLYIICGLTTIVSGILGATPVLISPESAAGIKAGAKSGLSTCICGVLFGLSAFFGPLFAAVPAAGTAPLLLMIGVLLFQNVQRIPWSESRLAVPAFCCLFFIPLTYNLSHGIYIAIFLYISIGIFTTDFWITALKFCDNYYFEIRNAFAAFNSKGDFILTTSTARDEDSFRLSSCLNNRNVEERESRFNSDTTNSKAKATFDGIENPNHSTSSTIMSQNFDGKETDAVTEANSEKHEGQIPALHNRARIATVVLRGGSKFDMRLPQQRYHSSLLFLEGNDGDDALQRYLDLEEPQASLQASAFNISRNRSRTS